MEVSYLVVAYLVCLGTVQLAAAHSRLSGLLILPWVRGSYVLGAALPLGALLWLTVTGKSGVPGDTAGIEGAEQFTLFCLAAGLATATSAALASVVRWGMSHSARPQPGMEGLRNATILQLLQPRLSRRVVHRE